MSMKEILGFTLQVCGYDLRVLDNSKRRNTPYRKEKESRPAN